MQSMVKMFAAALALVASQAIAQGYPTKPVHAIISFTAGSSTDIVGRTVMQKVSEYWGQPVVSENRAGAGGSIGAAAMIKAGPDGYTLLIDSSAHAITPAMYANLPYDTAKDFIDVAALAIQPNVLVVAPGSPIKSVADLVARAKAKPGTINFGSAGVGSGTHLNLEKFKLATGIDVVHVPYKGTPEVMSDLMGGRVDCYFAPISAVMPFVRDGRVRALAVSTASRSGQLPEVPTVAESGVPGFEFSLWFGVWAPAGTSADIVDRIAKDVNRALADAGVRDRLAKLGNDPLTMSTAEFARFVRREVEDYARIIRAAGIKPQ